MRPVLARLAAPALAGALTLATVTAGPAAAQTAERRAANPTGVAAGSTANGKGNLKVALANTASGKLRISWARPTKLSNIKKWTVRVGVNRLMDNHVRTYRVKARKRALVVPHAWGATPSSGNFSFVQVLIRRTNGQKGASPVKWIQAPLGASCPSGATQVRVGTFNIRGWRWDKGHPSFDWNKRAPRVVGNILSSGARAVSLQEASGLPDPQFGPDRQWINLVKRLNNANGSSGQWRNVFSDVYGDNGDGVGTRIIYDDAVYDLEGSGVRAISGGPQKSWIPWARLRHTASGKQFFLVSAHLVQTTTVAGWRARATQTRELIDLVSDLRAVGGGTEQVVLGGDLNSTVNTKPDNNVHKMLMDAGFYDSFATARIVNSRYGTGNAFNFPVRATPSRRDYILTYGPLRGSCFHQNMAYRTVDQVASDHFMQVASLPLP